MRDPSKEERDYYSFQKRAWTLFAPFYDAVVAAPFRNLRRQVASFVELPPGTTLPPS